MDNALFLCQKWGADVLAFEGARAGEGDIPDQNGVLILGV